VEQEADQAKGSWQGATFDDMVMRWGPPNRSATLSDGRQTHTWTSQKDRFARGALRSASACSAVRRRRGRRRRRHSVRTTVNPPICERTVTFQENKVVDQNWTGDPGYCRYFKRA
jgi:hypothetical protein